MTAGSAIRAYPSSRGAQAPAFGTVLAFYDWTRALAEVRALVRDAPELESPPGFSL